MCVHSFVFKNKIIFIFNGLYIVDRGARDLHYDNNTYIKGYQKLGIKYGKKLGAKCLLMMCLL